MRQPRVDIGGLFGAGEDAVLGKDVAVICGGGSVQMGCVGFYGLCFCISRAEDL